MSAYDGKFAPVIHVWLSIIDAYSLEQPCEDRKQERYISVEAIKHHSQPLSKLPPECKAAHPNYHPLSKLNGEAPVPCPVCAAVEQALKQ